MKEQKSRVRPQVRSEHRTPASSVYRCEINPDFVSDLAHIRWACEQHERRLEARKLAELDRLERRVRRVKKFMATGEMPHKRQTRKARPTKPGLLDAGLRRIMMGGLRSHVRDMRRWYALMPTDALPLPE